VTNRHTHEQTDRQTRRRTDDTRNGVMLSVHFRRTRERVAVPGTTEWNGPPPNIHSWYVKRYRSWRDVTAGNAKKMSDRSVVSIRRFCCHQRLPVFVCLYVCV